MNDVLRILDRLLKKHGYAIKKHHEYNLLPLKDFNNLVNQEKVYKTFNSNNKNRQSNIDELEICLRTCINEKRTKGKRSELTNVSIEEHLLKCINSLVISTNEATRQGIKIKFTVFDDHSDRSTIKKIEILLDKLVCDWQIITTENPGQGESLYQHFLHAKNKNSLFYFCEDDFLHIPSAIYEMMVFYKNVFDQTSSHILIHPQEHELIYSQYNYPSYILLGENRRWRTMSHTTHTFFTHSDVVSDYWEYFENTKFVGIKEKRHLGSEKKTTDRLFNHILGFSPIPAVAVHLQTEQCLPPFFNWREIWGKIK